MGNLLKAGSPFISFGVGHDQLLQRVFYLRFELCGFNNEPEVSKTGQ